MSELYLILHKVRGEPAFDIACPLDVGDKEGWIIPTSGHRAYPYWQRSLSQLTIEPEGFHAPAALMLFINNFDFNAWPDHYQLNTSPKAERAEANSLLLSLGLPTKVHSAVSGTLKRRI